MHHRLNLLAAATLWLAAGAAGATSISNGSFEANTAGVGTTGYCYLGTSCAANAIDAWAGTATVIGASSDPWQTPSAQAGWNAAWGDTVVGVQNAAYIEQQLNFSAGTQQLSWVDANRNGYSNARYEVWLDGSSLGTFNTTVGGGWTERGLSFVASAGLHTLRWQGVAIASDATAFIDNLSITTAVPEPTTALMMLGGLAALGLRRRQR